MLESDAQKVRSLDLTSNVVCSKVAQCDGVIILGGNLRIKATEKNCAFEFIANLKTIPYSDKYFLINNSHSLRR